MSNAEFYGPSDWESDPEFREVVMPLTDPRLAEIEQKFLAGEYTMEQMENAIKLHERFQMLELYFATTDEEEEIEEPEEK